MNDELKPRTETAAITKTATEYLAYRRPSISFRNARTAFLALIQALGISQEEEILLPSYIGWSSREGSGVFDPVTETGARYRFYRMSPRLEIDVEDLRAKLVNHHPRLLVLIHYFGYPDTNIQEIVHLARSRGVLVLEDEAHSLYSDWIGGSCGRFGDAAIMSLHKMLPLPEGGLLIANASLDPDLLHSDVVKRLQKPLQGHPSDFDLYSIAMVRRANAIKLYDLLEPLRKHFEPLFPLPPEGVVPQTVPVVVHELSRDDLYFALNAVGYGVVSLYHTLIEQISASDYPEMHKLSRCVLNLPVHQDASQDQLAQMIQFMAKLIKTNKS